MGPHGNGRRLPGALVLLLGLAAALAYFHDDVAVFGLGLRAGPSADKEMTESLARLEKSLAKYEKDVAFFEVLKKEHAAAKGGEKQKVSKRWEDWMKHCRGREEDVTGAKKWAKQTIQESKECKKPEIKKAAEEATKKFEGLRQRWKTAHNKLLELAKYPL